MRLIFVPAVILTDPSAQQVAWLSVGSFAASFTTHVVLADYLIRRPTAIAEPESVRGTVAI